ncbi:MAG: aspartate kinase [Candidatus Ornithospirochaeta sp.]|nr:aspartate kinase [Candidatus Ornithospirochaeta sp.]
MIVCKFGGSSVADASQIKKVKAILESDEKRSIAVVSAPGKRNKEDQKITDLLYKCNELVQKGQSCRPVFNQIAKRYSEIAHELKLNDEALGPVLDEVRCLIDAGRGADFAASRGEYLSAFIISQYLGWEFIDASDIIVINADSTVNDLTYEKLAKAIEPGRKYIIPGFYGETEQGIVKTFSRGGSDITGAIISKAVNAELYENWTDVSGILSADPRVVENPKPIQRMSYNQVRELSDVGASVFHEEAIAPVVNSLIPINVRNTNRPEDPGTMIVPEVDSADLVGVSAKGGLSRIKLRKLMLFKKYGMRHALLTMLHIFGIRPSYSLFGIDSIVWFFDSRMANESVCQAMCERLKKEFALDSISVDYGHALLGIVGGRMDESTSYIDALAALKENGIEVTCVNYGSSDKSVLIGVKENQKDDAVRTVYSKLF